MAKDPQIKPLKRPSAASLKRVNAANLAGLGAERLADLLLAVAETRPDLKRQLRMELAAEQGVDHLAVEIDKRLTSLETLRTKVSWRQRPAFLRDLEALHHLIAGRMAELDAPTALGRLLRFLNTAGHLSTRLRDKHGELDILFNQAASDLAPLLSTAPAGPTASQLAGAIELNPRAWVQWLPLAMDASAEPLAAATLVLVQSLRSADQPSLVRSLADVARDVEAYRGTYSQNTLEDPAVAAALGARLLTAGRAEEAGQVLEAARPPNLDDADTKVSESDAAFAWETIWIEYLERTGQIEAAQSARWRSFERTLSVDRAKAFVRRLKDFDDVEAEERAFSYAAKHPSFQRGLVFLMNWPAIAEAGRMIEGRAEDVRVEDEQAELWAAKLARVKPRAAELLLRNAAAIAFKRRNYAAADRLTKEADALDL